MDLQREIQRTRPDFTVYVPKSSDGSTGDTGNEHFLVFNGPQGNLCTIWTQSSFEGKPDQHIVFSTSEDGGRTWEPPRTIAEKSGEKGMASWAFPLVSKSGRIYVIYNRHIGVNDIFTHTTGRMEAICSDDGGATWSAGQTIEMPRTRWDNPDPAIPANWIVWQRPDRLSDGKYYVGFTHWVSPKVRKPAPLRVWWAEAAVVEFMRFENVDDDPEPGRIVISYHAHDGKALQMDLPEFPGVSCIQEPSIVKLPDRRLFCATRTATGHPCYTVSADAGDTWSEPRPLRQADHLRPFLHPVSPCPIYRIGEGEYAFFFHNHDGHFGGWGPFDTTPHRRPIWIARGLFRPEAKQPLWFSEPRMFFDNDGIKLLRTDLAMYASLTIDDESPILWYPERKFFLLGKRIRREMLDEMAVPEQAGQKSEYVG
ncbi:exo-alpha-sialidase [bacterium]|nr:exo-alpha-sialidase [bacterium]